MTRLGVLLAEPLPSPAYSSECGPLQAAFAQSQPASPCAPATPAPSHDGSFRGSAFSSTTSSSNSATVQPVPRPYSPTVANATRQPMPRPCSPTAASPVQPVPSAAAYQPPAPGAAVAALPHASTFRRPSPAPCTAAPPAPCPYPAAAVQQAAAYPQPASPPACAPVAAPELCPAPAVPCGVYSYPDGSSCATVLPLAPIAPPLAPWTASHGEHTTLVCHTLPLHALQLALPGAGMIGQLYRSHHTKTHSPVAVCLAPLQVQSRRPQPPPPPLPGLMASSSPSPAACTSGPALGARVHPQ